MGQIIYKPLHQPLTLWENLTLYVAFQTSLACLVSC